MATFDAYVAVDMRQFSLYSLFTNPIFDANGAQHFDVIQDNADPSVDYILHVEGLNFDYGSDEDPNSGLITDLSLGEGIFSSDVAFFDHKYFDLFDISMTIAQFQYYATRPAIETAQFLFGGDDTVLGSEGTDYLRSFAGNDILNGQGGADTMLGGGGNDTYVVDNAGDRVFEGASPGTDRVNASVSFTLASEQYVETLGTTSAAGTAAINLTGNEFAQTLYGNAGANVIKGAGGADLAYGFGGNDTYIVDNLGDKVFEAAGGGTADRVNAGVSYALAAGQQVEILGTTSAAGTGAINLTGNELSQTIYGNAGANFLNGLGGPDTLTGFGGADFFSFTTALGAGNVDRITDYSAPADTIRLAKAVFSVLNTGTLSATAYKDIGDPGATVDASDRILYDDNTGALYYDTNGSVDGGRLHFATLDNRPATLTNADFVVVA